MGDEIRWTERAKLAMKGKKITYKEMGVELGLSESAVSHQLNERRGVTVKQIKVYAKMLQMSLSELVGDDAVFVSDEKQKKAVEIMKNIPEDKKELALKMLEAFLDAENTD